MLGHTVPEVGLLAPKLDDGMAGLEIEAGGRMEQHQGAKDAQGWPHDGRLHAFEFGWGGVPGCDADDCS